MSTTTVNEEGYIVQDVPASSSTAIAEFDPVELGLIALRTQISETHYDITTPAGERTARELRRLCIGLRTGTDEVYEALNRPMLQRQGAIRALKKHIQDSVLLLEKPIDAAIKAQESLKETERLRKAAIEEARVQDLRLRIQGIASLPASAVRLTADGIAAIDHSLSELVVDESAFAEFTEEVAGLKAYIRGQLGELFALALARESEAERLRLEAIRLENQRQQQAQEAGQRARIVSLQAYPLQAIGQNPAAIVQLMENFPFFDTELFGALADEAEAAHRMALAQMIGILAARQNADQVASEILQRAQAAEAERERDQAAAAQRQQDADAQHAARSQELKRQQDAFELEKQEARRIQSNKEAAVLAERRAIEAKLAALQPKPAAPALAPKLAPALVAPAATNQPSDAAIVTALSEVFEVDTDTVLSWLHGFDADAVKAAMTYEEIPA